MHDLIAVEKIAQWEKLKGMVLDSVSSPITKRVYAMALTEFMAWFQQAPRPGFTKATVSAWRVLVNFRNMYGFLSQVLPYQDSDLEQLYTYMRFLLTKLPKRDTGPGYHLEEEVELQYYRRQKISEGQIDLNTGDGKPLKGPSDVGTGQEDPEIKLSELIDILNERFRTDFTQADQLFFDQIQEEAIEREMLKKAAAANSKDDFRYVFEKAFEAW